MTDLEIAHFLAIIISEEGFTLSGFIELDALLERNGVNIEHFGYVKTQKQKGLVNARHFG